MTPASSSSLWAAATIGANWPKSLPFERSSAASTTSLDQQFVDSVFSLTLASGIDPTTAVAFTTPDELNDGSGAGAPGASTDVEVYSGSPAGLGCASGTFAVIVFPGRADRKCLAG